MEDDWYRGRWGHGDAIRALKFLPKQKSILVLSGQKLWSWNLEGDSLDIEPIATDVTAFAVSPDGRCLVTGTESGTLCVYDKIVQCKNTLLKMTKIWERQIANAQICHIAFSQHGRKAVVVAADGTVWTWVPDVRAKPKRLDADWPEFDDIAYHPSGAIMGLSRGELRIRYCEQAKTEQTVSLPLQEMPFDGAISGDGHYVTSGGYEDGWVVWRIDL